MDYGYNRKIARIDLSNHSVKVEEPEESTYKRYLGGRGLGVYYLFRDLPPRIDPLGLENELIFATSVLTGTPIA